MSTPSSSSSTLPYTIKVAQTKDEIEACYDIRLEVFAVEQGFPLDTEIDEFDPDSTHFLLTVPVASPPDVSPSALNPLSAASVENTTQKPVGTIRWTPSVSKLSRLAVVKDYRGHGFAKKLVEAIHQHARKQGAKYMSLHSQMQVVPFYEKLGYQKEGPIFDEEGAPHQKMVLPLDTTVP